MRKLLSIFIILFSLSLSSCFVNRTTVGDGPVGKNGVRYSHVKQMSLFWGLWAFKGHPQPAVPPGCGYQVKTSFNFIDGLVTTLTGGIFGMRSVKIMVNKGGPCDPAILKVENRENKDIQKIEQRDHKGN